MLGAQWDDMANGVPTGTLFSLWKAGGLMVGRARCYEKSLSSLSTSLMSHLRDCKWDSFRDPAITSLKEVMLWKWVEDVSF